MARRRKNLNAFLEGADELNKALRSVGDRVGGKILRNAAEAGAEVIAEEARRIAPRDTGALAEGIGTAVHRAQQGRAQINVAPSRETWYGALVELGTEKKPAHPFLRPAFDAKSEEATMAVQNALYDALKEVLS